MKHLLTLLICLALTSAAKGQEIKVIAFDLFGTVYDFADTPRNEIRDYVRHVRAPEWSPLALPTSWSNLRPFPDSASGIAKLRDRYTVVSCSNANLGLQIHLSKASGVSFDGPIPLELARVYKPNPKAYLLICETLGVKPEEVLMVTANRTAGDLEAATALGMRAVLIRSDGVTDINDLAAKLESSTVPFFETVSE